MACLSMITKLSIESLEEYIGKDCMEHGYKDYYGSGLNQYEIHFVLCRLGYPNMLWVPRDAFGNDYANACRDSIIFHPDIDEYKDHTMIISVPSLNNEGQFHWIVWHDSRIYDPSPKNVYVDGDDLNVDMAIILMEKIK